MLTMTDAAFESLRTRGITSLGCGALDDARRLFDAAENLASTPGETALAQIHLASVSVLQGVQSDRIDALPRLLMRHDSPLHMYLASYYLAIHLAEKRKLSAAARYVRLALHAADEMANPYYLAAAYDVGAEIAICRGDFGAASDYAACAANAIADCPVSRESAMAHKVIAHNHGYALLGRGHYEKAIAPLREGAASLEACGARVYAGHAYMNLSFAYFALSDI